MHYGRVNQRKLFSFHGKVRYPRRFPRVSTTPTVYCSGEKATRGRRGSPPLGEKRGQNDLLNRSDPFSPPGFSRKVSVRSVGENTRQQVEEYIANQVGKQRFLDLRFEAALRPFTIRCPEVDQGIAARDRAGVPKQSGLPARPGPDLACRVLRRYVQRVRHGAPFAAGRSLLAANLLHHRASSKGSGSESGAGPWPCVAIPPPRPPDAAEPHDLRLGLRLGHLVPVLVNSSIGQFEVMNFVAGFFVAVLPVLEHFSMESAISTGQRVPWAYLAPATVYAALYSLMALFLALLLFADRDMA